MADPTKIFRVDSVSVVRNKMNPPEMHTTAKGTCTTTGWTSGRLSRYQYVTPPADGIQEYDFVAIPPSGIIHETLTPIEAEDSLSPIPNWCKGVRVHARTNKIEGKL